MVQSQSEPIRAVHQRYRAKMNQSEWSTNGTEPGLGITSPVTVFNNVTNVEILGITSSINVSITSPVTIINNVTNGEFNLSMDGKTSTATISLYGLEPASRTNILYGFVAFAAVTVVVNLLVLIASKFATGGKSSTFIFIRSLLFSDALIGVYGISKSSLLTTLDYRRINCFLPESMFLSASTATCFTLLWLNIDTYLRLTRPLGSINSMDKHNVIITMVILWNTAFIVGFLPQMGWNNDEFHCDLFRFYSIHYIVFTSLIWIGSIIGCSVTHVLLNRASQQIRLNNRFISPRSMEFLKYTRLINMIRNDTIILSVCYLPLLGYIFYYFTNNRYNTSNMANSTLIFFLPIFLVRSFVSAIIHSYQIIQLQCLMRNVSKQMSHISLCKTLCCNNGAQSLDSINQSVMNSTATLDTNRNGTDCNSHKLVSSNSRITIVIEDAVEMQHTALTKL